MLRGKKLKFKRIMKSLLLKNKKLKRQNRINRTMVVRFRAKLNEARRSVPIRFSVESALKTRYFVFPVTSKFCLLYLTLFLQRILDRSLQVSDVFGFISFGSIHGLND